MVYATPERSRPDQVSFFLRRLLLTLLQIGGRIARMNYILNHHCPPFHPVGTVRQLQQILLKYLRQRQLIQHELPMMIEITKQSFCFRSIFLPIFEYNTKLLPASSPRLFFLLVIQKLEQPWCQPSESQRTTEKRHELVKCGQPTVGLICIISSTSLPDHSSGYCFLSTSFTGQIVFPFPAVFGSYRSRSGFGGGSPWQNQIEAPNEARFGPVA